MLLFFQLFKIKIKTVYTHNENAHNIIRMKISSFFLSPFCWHEMMIISLSFHHFSGHTELTHVRNYFCISHFKAMTLIAWLQHLFSQGYSMCTHTQMYAKKSREKQLKPLLKFFFSVCLANCIDIQRLRGYDRCHTQSWINFKSEEKPNALAALATFLSRE